MINLLFQLISFNKKRKDCSNDVWNEKSQGYYYRALSIMCEILENISAGQTPVFQSETIKAFENAVDYMENNYTSDEFSINKTIPAAIW